MPVKETVSLFDLGIEWFCSGGARLASQLVFTASRDDDATPAELGDADE